jgi:hypothetical protein
MFYLSIFGMKLSQFKLIILTCSEDVGEEGVEWEIPLVDVAEGAAALLKECGSAGKWGSGDVCKYMCKCVGVLSV